MLLGYDSPIQLVLLRTSFANGVCVLWRRGTCGAFASGPDRTLGSDAAAEWTLRKWPEKLMTADLLSAYQLPPAGLSWPLAALSTVEGAKKGTRLE